MTVSSFKTRYKIVRRGFTLIEMLVCISVITILTGLTIQAVVAVRESSRSMVCRNNLRQIGIAIQSYSTTFEVVPPGKYGYDGRSYNEISPFLKLLPHLEMTSIYNAYNYLDEDRSDTPLIQNRTVRHTKVEIFICPSDNGSLLLNSYVFNVGSSLIENGSATNNGPFGLFKLLKPESMTNGLSNTAFLSERLRGSFNIEAANPARDFKLISFSSLNDFVDELSIPLCEKTEAKSWHIKSGRYWLYWSPFHTVYSHSSMPNDKRSACGGVFFGILPARSNHSGSVHVLFGDAHTQRISSRIDRTVWEKMGKYK